MALWVSIQYCSNWGPLGLHFIHIKGTSENTMILSGEISCLLIGKHVMYPEPPPWACVLNWSKDLKDLNVVLYEKKM